MTAVKGVPIRDDDQLAMGARICGNRQKTALLYCTSKYTTRMWRTPLPTLLPGGWTPCTVVGAWMVCWILVQQIDWLLHIRPSAEPFSCAATLRMGNLTGCPKLLVT